MEFLIFRGLAVGQTSGYTDDMELKKPVVFFDGHCNLCNRWVDWLVRLDKDQKIFIASIQGETALELLPESMREDLQTFILYEDSRFFYKSRAVFRLAGILKGPLSLLLIFGCFPRGLTDWFYDLVAKNRYRFLSRRKTCRVPTEQEREHFLQ